MHILPDNSGIGLKPKHFRQIIDTPPNIGWFEVHPENYMSNGGLDHSYLNAISEHFPISMHGVGMSLGSVDGINKAHLSELKKLVDKYQPASLSEHLAWSHWKQNYFNDLLPIPYTHESLKIATENINQVQTYLNRQILIENPSVYLSFENNDYTETEFLRSLVEATGCHLLLDVNNVFVSASNTGFSPHEYINDIPLASVKEIHLAGHTLMPLTDSLELRIDDHGSKVSEDVWELFRYTITKAKRKLPTLIEWDTDIPELSVLIREAEKADVIMNNIHCTEGRV